MRRLPALLFAAPLALLPACAGPRSTEKPPVALAPKPEEAPMPARRWTFPSTRLESIVDTLHGVAVADPFRWLEDSKSSESKAWMAEQDRYARAALAKLPAREGLRDRLQALFYVDSVSAPQRRGSRYFYRRTHANREKAIYYWRQGEAGEEKVLLDPNTMSTDGTVSLGEVVPSWDGNWVAYTRKANNSDDAVLHLLEVATGKEVAAETIEGAKYASPSWAPPGKGTGFYYTWLPPVSDKVTIAERPGFAEVRFHALGTDPAKDTVVHGPTHSAETFLGASVSRDGRWLFVSIQHGWNSTEVYYRDLRDKKWTAFRPFVEKLDAQFEVEAHAGRFYVRTNHEAPRWRLFSVDPARPARAQWTEIVPQDPHAVLEGVQLVGGKLGLTWLRDASTHLELRGLDGKGARAVALPGLGTSGGFVGLPEDDTAYYSFVSFTQPQQIYRASVKEGRSSLYTEVKLPIDSSKFVVEQVRYPSKDGTLITLFLVRRKDLVRDGSTPLLLTGYGGFNHAMTPGFSSALYPWLEAGGAYALPNLRGGGEYGEEWHRQGMGARKQNVFDDFIAAAEWLVKEGYTRPDRLAIRGGSNGGLLVGAAMTQRPELFRAVVCAVPLLDMVRYHKFGSGRTWIPEYGSADDAEQFKTLFAYSPYHHVQPGVRYPSLLMLSATDDDRVDPLHARKMVAEVQRKTASDLPVLLRIEPHAGHGGADLVKQAVEQGADVYAFLLHELGMDGAATAR